MTLPRVLFIGPHKSGTTWIDHYLRSRGDVLLPQRQKETFWFDKQYHKGRRWYEAQFGDVSAAIRTIVEVAPSLFDKPEAARRVAHELPDVTVVCTMRNPVERAVAHYFHHLKGGEPDCGFAAMAEKHPEIVNNGRYLEHLNMWVELLGRDRVKVLEYSRLSTDPAGYCEQICALLDIPVQVPPDAVLYARVNEDGVPSFPLLAKASRRVAETLRFAGAHAVVNVVRARLVRKIVYGRRPDEAMRKRVEREAIAYHAQFLADTARLDRLFGVDTTTWRGKPAQPRQSNTPRGRRAAPGSTKVDLKPTI